MVWIDTKGLWFPLQYGSILINWQVLMRTSVWMYQSMTSRLRWEKGKHVDANICTDVLVYSLVCQ